MQKRNLKEFLDLARNDKEFKEKIERFERSYKEFPKSGLRT